MNCPICNNKIPDGSERCPGCGYNVGDTFDHSVKDEDVGWSPPEEEQALLAKQLTGEYEITGIIGEGSMGVVFKANQLRLSRIFAIKVLRLQFADQPKIVQRFLNEAQVAARLRHPNIVNIIDVKKVDRLIYFIMDYIGDQNLEMLIEEEEKLPVMRALNYAIDICDALDHAHAHNVIHRDIKPSNIVLASSDGRPVLTDFSIAKISQEGSDSGMTVIGTIIGTYWYMSPEQFRAKGAVDHRSDIYSFGALLFEMLTGYRPFTCETLPELMHAHLNQPPIPPSELVAEIPEELDKIVLQCLEKSQANRYQSAKDLRLDMIACKKNIENAGMASKAEPAEAIDYLAVAQDAIARHDYIQARLELNRMSQRHADYPEAMVMLAQVNNKLKAIQDAEDAYMDGKAALERDQIDRAIKFFSNALALNPYHEKAKAELLEAKRLHSKQIEITSLATNARKALEARDYEMVISTCEKMLQIDPKHGEAQLLKETAQQSMLIEEKKKKLFVQANEQRTKGDLESALKTVRQIKDLDPSTMTAHDLEQELLKLIGLQKRIQEYINMAKEQSMRQDFEAEIETWNKLIGISPERQKEFQELKQRAIKASEEKKHVENLLQKASEFMKKDAWDDTAKLCEKILFLNKDHEQAQTMLHQAHSQIEKEQKARELIATIEHSIAQRKFREAREQLGQLFQIYPRHTKYNELEEKLQENQLRVDRIKENLKLIHRSAENANLADMKEALKRLDNDLLLNDPEFQLLRLMQYHVDLLDQYFSVVNKALGHFDNGNLNDTISVLLSTGFSQPKAVAPDSQRVKTTVITAVPQQPQPTPQPFTFQTAPLPTPPPVSVQPLPTPQPAISQPQPVIREDSDSGMRGDKEVPTQVFTAEIEEPAPLTVLPPAPLPVQQKTPVEPVSEEEEEEEEEPEEEYEEEEEFEEEESEEVAITKEEPKVDTGVESQKQKRDTKELPELTEVEIEAVAEEEQETGAKPIAEMVASRQQERPAIVVGGPQLALQQQEPQQPESKPASKSVLSSWWLTAILILLIMGFGVLIVLTVL